MLVWREVPQAIPSPKVMSEPSRPGSGGTLGVLWKHHSWEKGQVTPGGLQAARISGTFWRVWFSRTSCCFLQTTVRWEILKRWDFHYFSLNFCFFPSLDFVVFVIFLHNHPAFGFPGLCAYLLLTERFNISHQAFQVP